MKHIADRWGQIQKEEGGCHCFRSTGWGTANIDCSVLAGTKQLTLGPGIPSSPFGPGGPGKPYRETEQGVGERVISGRQVGLSPVNSPGLQVARELPFPPLHRVDPERQDMKTDRSYFLKYNILDLVLRNLIFKVCTMVTAAVHRHIQYLRLLTTLPCTAIPRGPVLPTGPRPPSNPDFPGGPTSPWNTEKINTNLELQGILYRKHAL